MTDPLVRLVVRGRPAPQGSKKPIIIRKGGAMRAGMIDEPTLGLTSWRQAVHDAAIAHLRDLCGCGDPICTAMPPGYPLNTPLRAAMLFLFKRPATHYGSGRNAHQLKPTAPPHPATTGVGDASKLARAVEDALQSAGLLRDDALIVGYGPRLFRAWCDDHPELQVPGAVIELWRMDGLLDAVGTRRAGTLFDPIPLT